MAVPTYLSGFEMKQITVVLIRQIGNLTRAKHETDNLIMDLLSGRFKLAFHCVAKS